MVSRKNQRVVLRKSRHLDVREDQVYKLMLITATIYEHDKVSVAGAPVRDEIVLSVAVILVACSLHRSTVKFKTYNGDRHKIGTTIVTSVSIKDSHYVQQIIETSDL